MPNIHPTATIALHCVIAASASIGAFCRIASGVVIGPGVQLGTGCTIGANSVVSHAVLGARVTLGPGVMVGQDGFGLTATPTGLLTVPQLGRVMIGDDVHIGAGSTIDRGSARDTVIGAGAHVDKAVQIGHNVTVGSNCVLHAQSGIAGSTELEGFVVLGPQVAVNGHKRIGAGATIEAQSGVFGNVEPGAHLSGFPALPVAETQARLATLRRLAHPEG